MKIAITGANGFIGSAVSQYLLAKGWTVLHLSRQEISMPAKELAAKLKGTNVVLNLAGAPIISRWTEVQKKILHDSRILTTRKLVGAIFLMPEKPGLLLSGSAIGIYRDTGSHTENDYTYSDDFLGKISLAWEVEALKAPAETRVVLLRTGVVLGKSGGALAKMILPFRIGLGGIIASGKQGFSWIHLQDMVRAIEYLIEHKEMSGAFNFTAPSPVDNLVFTQTLGKALHRPTVIPVPAFALKLLYGEGAATVTGGQTVYPEKLIQAGFQFRFGTIQAALEDILKTG